MHHIKQQSFADPYSHSVSVKGGQINLRYYIRCMRVNSHILRVNSQNQKKLVYDRIFITQLFSSLAETFAGEDKIFYNTQPQ